MTLDSTLRQGAGVLRRLPGWGSGLALVVLLGAHQLLQIADRSMLGIALNNAAHTPFFFVLTLLAYSLAFGARPFAALRRLPVLLCALAVVAALTEVMQLFTGRSASVEDWGRDTLGIAAAASLLLALRDGPAQARRRFAFAALGAVLMAAGFVTVAGVLERNFRRDARLPDLLPFEPAALAAEARIGGHWRLEADPARDGPSLWLDLDGGRFPGLTLREPFPDWRNYNSLVIDGRAAGAAPVPLTLRVETFADHGTGNLREVVLGPARQEHRVPLAALVAGSPGARASIRNLFLYAEEGAQGEPVILYGIRLE